MAHYQILDWQGNLVEDNLTEEQAYGATSGSRGDGFGYYWDDTQLISDWATAGEAEAGQHRIVKFVE